VADEVSVFRLPLRTAPDPRRTRCASS
jgi:hypothetical protein